MKSEYYRNKPAIVTGAGSGIGRALAVKLAEYGASYVGVFDINIQSANETAKLVEEKGAQAVPIECDVSNKEGLKDSIDAFVEQSKSLGFMFNNAGILFSYDQNIPIEDRYEKVISINLLGQVYGSINAIRHMKSQKSGHIVNVSSIAGLVPGIAGTAYATSKSGIVGYTLGLKRDLASMGVRASVLCPAAIATPMEGFGPGLKPNSTKFNYMAPDAFAVQALEEIAKNKVIIPIGYMSKPLWNLFRVSPSLYDRAMASSNVYSADVQQ
ncbi:MAG: SDR family oxidoreductase [Eubacteriaceae bacterium]|nr:SDR family oxidoreductase [Eubacteriaceae bacterium]